VVHCFDPSIGTFCGDMQTLRGDNPREPEMVAEVEVEEEGKVEIEAKARRRSRNDHGNGREGRVIPRVIIGGGR